MPFQLDWCKNYMPFPKKQRVLFNKSPLKKVIFQLRFTPILKIDTETPAEFQDMLRDVFSLYSERIESPIPEEIAKSMPPDMLSQILSMGKTANTNHSFSTENEEDTVHLTRTFMAFSTDSYVRWEQFRDQLELPLAALRKVYHPNSYTRIGLRYTDYITRSEIGLAPDTPWRDLLEPHILGPLSDKTLSAHIKQQDTRTLIELDDQKGEVQIISNLIDRDGEESLVIDMDFYSDNRISDEEVDDYLEYFRVRSNRLFQWCLKKQLYDALEPNQI